MTRRTSLNQQWDPQLYSKNARFVGDLAGPAVSLLAPLPGDRILDIGCGDGYLTERIAEHGATMVGIDFSQALVEAAVARGIDARYGNAEAMCFDAEFDAVFSNAALHWMRDPDALIAGVVNALKPGGRFVGEFAGANNARAIRREVHAALQRRGFDADEVDPWYLPTLEEYALRLERGGMKVVHIELFNRPVIIEYPIAGWIKTFGSPYLTVLPNDDERDRMLVEVTERLESELHIGSDRWSVDYTRLRFRAEKSRTG